MANAEHLLASCQRVFSGEAGTATARAGWALAVSTDGAWLVVVAHRFGQVAAADVADADIDVVIDCVSGKPTGIAIVTERAERADPGKPLISIAIGSVAGPTALVPSAALRAARLQHPQIAGSGQGSVSAREILVELTTLALAITSGTFDIDERRGAIH